MLLPSFLYGKYADVKKRVKNVLKELRSGKSWDEIMPGELMETNEHEGMIVLEGPSSLIGAQEHFNIYVFMHQFYFGSDSDPDTKLEEEIFSRAMETSWGVMLFMGDARLRCFNSKLERMQKYIEACYRFRGDVFDKKLSFTCGRNFPETIFNIPASFAFCLAKLGVSNEEIQLARQENRLSELFIEFVEKSNSSQ